MFRPRPRCPHCGSERAVRGGRTPVGPPVPLQGLRGAVVALSGPALEGCKKDFPTGPASWCS